MDIIVIWLAFWGYVTDRWAARHFFKAIGAVVGFLLGCAALIGLFWVIVYGVAVLIANFWPVLAVIVGIPAFLVFKYIEHKGKAKPVEAAPTPQPASIELARARADGILPLMKQTAFLLFCELSHYLPGITKPFALRSVEAPTPYTITASMETIFHTVIVKGADETPGSMVREILESLILNHLRANDLPLAIPATYTNEAGETYPGLVIDKLHDATTYWRVDFAITNEAVTARLKARAVEKLEGLSGAGVLYDEEF